MRRIAVLVAVPLALVLALPTWAHAAPPQSVTYRPPVDAPIVDAFRPPAERWSAGNRGVEYATTSGEPVAAAADGVVAFAGQVGGQLHVVVLHADGVRTTYAFLRSIEVRRGDTVAQGQRVGTAADTVHFGARIGEVYVDPVLLFGDGPPEVHLVPDDDRGLLLGGRGEERPARPARRPRRRAPPNGRSTGSRGRSTTSSPSCRAPPTTWARPTPSPTWSASATPASTGCGSGPMHAGRRGPAPAAGAAPGGAGGRARLQLRARPPSTTSTPPPWATRTTTSPASPTAAPTPTVMPYEPFDTTADLRQSARLLREYLQQVEEEHPGRAHRRHRPLPGRAGGPGGPHQRVRRARPHPAPGLVAGHAGHPPPGRRPGHRRRHDRRHHGRWAGEVGRRPGGHALGPQRGVAGAAVGDVVVHPRPQPAAPPRRPVGDLDRRPRRHGGPRREDQVRRRQAA